MAKIISILTLSFIGWKVTGYDFFILTSLASFTIDIYIELIEFSKNITKILKIKIAKR